jgi:hypothetical protein
MNDTRTVVLKLRQGQRHFMRVVEAHRLCAFLARRQYGKTTLFASIALKKMMKRKNHTIIFGSAKINLAREVVRKEAAVFQSALSLLREQAANKNRLQVTDALTGKAPDQLNADDFASLFEAQRLEFRYYHSDSVYSRTKVVALLPDTVGETGDLMCDEIGRVKNWREVWEAIEPIISSDPTFRCLFCTTPPPDDTHFSFEMLVPPIGLEFPINPEGNIYRSELGIQVLRVDAFDAYADGIPVYDSDKGEPLDPAEHRRRSHDKDAWDRNYGVKFVVGGTAACSLMLMDTAQRRGVGECACFVIEEESDFARACEWLTAHLGAGPVGLGWDLATTEKETSNPSAFSVVEQRANEFLVRAVFVWKTCEPDVARDRVRRILAAVAARKEGGRARRLCIDATNERYFATDMRKDLVGIIPVELVIASETVEKAGQEPMTKKQFMGGQLVGALEDNQLTLPPERYLKEDFRLVKKERGSFVAALGPAGQHGDTFDGTKLGIHALTGRSGMDSMDGVITGANGGSVLLPRVPVLHLGKR